jgi:hypothetical protein
VSSPEVPNMDKINGLLKICLNPNSGWIIMWPIQSLVSLWFILVAHLTNVSVDLLLSGGVWCLLTFHILISSWNCWTNMN